MSYSNRSAKYNIPVIKEGDMLSGSEEAKAAKIIENQLRAGILGAGSTRVFSEGVYSTTVNSDDSVTVILTGSPGLLGIAGSGLVEVNTVTWATLAAGRVWYLYVRAAVDTYLNPDSVDVVAEEVEVVEDNYLFLAVLDATTPGAPTLDTAPAGKPTGQNLFDLLNSPVNPFGTSLTQQDLAVTNSLTVTLASTTAVSITQPQSAATSSPVTITNASSQPEIRSTGELRFRDTRVASLALSESGQTTLPVASSILGAINATAKHRTIFESTASATVGGTTAETTLVAAGEGSVTIAANTLAVGMRLKIESQGYFSTLSPTPGTVRLRVKLGSTTILDSGAISVNSFAGITNAPWQMNLALTVRAIGGSGSVIGNGLSHFSNGTTGEFVLPLVATSPVTVDTTASQAVNVTVEWGTSNAANTMTLTNLHIERSQVLA